MRKKKTLTLCSLLIILSTKRLVFGKFKKKNWSTRAASTTPTRFVLNYGNAIIETCPISAFYSLKKRKKETCPISASEYSSNSDVATAFLLWDSETRGAKPKDTATKTLWPKSRAFLLTCHLVLQPHLALAAVLRIWLMFAFHLYPFYFKLFLFDLLRLIYFFVLAILSNFFYIVIWLFLFIYVQINNLITLFYL